MGLQSFILSGVWVVGPVVGGLLAEAYGARNSFYLAGVGVGLCSIGYSQLPETLQISTSKGSTSMGRATAVDSSGSVGGRDSPGRDANDHAGDAAAKGGGVFWQSDTFSRMLPLLRSRNVQALSALAGATSIGQGCFMAVLTLHACASWDASPAEIGAMFSLTGVSFVAVPDTQIQPDEA